MWILLVVFVSMNHGFYASFTPADSYLLAFESSQNITFDLFFSSNRVKKLDKTRLDKARLKIEPYRVESRA